MSWHPGDIFEQDDEVTPELIATFVAGLLSNREFNKSEGYEGFIGCYGTFCFTDMVIDNIGTFLDRYYPEYNWTEDELEKWISRAPTENCKDLVRGVVKAIKDGEAEG